MAATVPPAPAKMPAPIYPVLVMPPGIAAVERMPTALVALMNPAFLMPPSTGAVTSSAPGMDSRRKRINDEGGKPSIVGGNEITKSARAGVLTMLPVTSPGSLLPRPLRNSPYRYPVWHYQ